MRKAQILPIVDAYLNIFAICTICWHCLVIPTEADVCSCTKSRCVSGTCFCEEMTAGSTCSVFVGPAPAAEKTAFGKYFMFFDDHYISWHLAKESCLEYWNGTLAMPSTSERHDFIFTTTCLAKLNERISAIWLGFSDIKAEGHWLFENGDSLNFAPVFYAGSTTVSGQEVSLPPLNSTSADERWHFYFTGNLSEELDRDDTRSLCNALGGGKLPNKLDHSESQRLITLAPDIQRVWLGIYLRRAGDLTSFEYANGDRVFLPRAWYVAERRTIPSDEDLSKYQAWNYPPEPDGRGSNSSISGPASCVMLSSEGWTDESCNTKLVPVCSYGPFPFERWHRGGSKFSEPNNGLGNEDCGVIRLDLKQEATHSYSDVLSEFWNDYDCELKFPFVCETVLPQGCVSYQGPHTLACMRTIWKEQGCHLEGEDHPDKHPPDKRRAWNSLNLLPLSWYIKKLKEDADFDETAQIQCFGIGFADGCVTFSGPHSRTCLENIWLKGGCKRTGYGFPGNSSATVNGLWETSNIREVSEDVQRIVNRSMTDQSTQLSCYGLTFPSNCSYHGPYSVTCLTAIWNNSGCIQEGLRHPEKLASAVIESFSELNIIQLIDSIQDNHDHASWQIQAQYNCFGLKFPSGCESYLGPHNGECHNSIWIEEGCLEEGNKSPSQRSNSENSTLNALDIRDLQRYVYDIIEDANAGTEQAQLDCYDLSFPRGCESYNGPNPISCYNTIWFDTGCLSEGYGFPQNTSGTTSLSVLNQLNLREVQDYVENIRNRANERFTDSQLDCYGKKFPSVCILYSGPHSLECQEFVWKDSGCIEEGLKHPSKLSDLDNATVNGLSIYELVNYTRHIFYSATNGVAAGQLNCYGVEFPAGCVNFKGPHTFECRNTIWNRSGCLEKGHAQPSNITSYEKVHLDKMNLRELLDHTAAIHDAALRLLDNRAQLLCFGLNFPNGCKTYLGPNSVSCYSFIWEKLGCLPEGELHPSKWSTSRKATVDAMNLREAHSYMADIKNKAHYLIEQSQLDCFGIKFPRGCIYYRGPHPHQCLRTVWEEEECVKEGYKYPDNLTVRSGLHDVRSMNLVKLRSYMNDIQQKAIGGDEQAQLDCYGLKFPFSCNSYVSPNPITCYEKIWRDVGCIPAGRKYPGKLPPAEKAILDGYNLRQIEEFVREIKNRSHLLDKEAQLDCFGIEFLDSCSFFRGPHSLECTTDLWQDVGCLEEGRKAPDHIRWSELVSYDQMDLVKLREHMKRYIERAEKGTVRDQLDCYGSGFPPGCTTYEGNHSVRCQKSTWFRSGCVKEGFDFPENTSRTVENDIVNSFTIRELQNYTDYLFSVSQHPTLEEEAQLACFGTNFPPGCTFFKGPHPLECQISIWYEEGCISEGYFFPANLSPTENSTVNKRSITNLRTWVSDLVLESQLDNQNDQLRCFGLKFPEECKFYRGPNTESCYNTIWRDVGCTKRGEKYPSKLSPLENLTYNEFNLREIINHTEYIKEAALALDPDSQKDCFGIEFMDGCSFYRGPHSLECQKSIWQDIGCIEEGNKYPENISVPENNTHQTMNLVKLKEHMQSFFKRAVIGKEEDAQLDCFGMKFPFGCERYQSPNPTDCFNSIWKEVGCKAEGFGYPENFSVHLNRTLNSLDLREVIDYTEEILQNATDLLDHQAQLQCFGIIFPQGCKFFRGPHPGSCMKSIWAEQGCVEEGFYYPKNLSKIEKAKISKLTIVEYRSYVKELRINATKLGSMISVDAQQQCFGMVYLPNCKYYRGPSLSTCFENIWLDVGCLSEGRAFPGTNMTAEVTNAITNYNLREIRVYVEGILHKAIEQKHKEYQLDCFGLIFPKKCRFFRGPHPLECQVNIWKMGGCVEEGQEFPTNLTPSENSTINSMTLQEVIDYVDNTSDAAEVSGDVQAQLKCYGLRFPNGCNTYQSPNHVDCYNSIWSSVGCLPEGGAYPAKLTTDQLRATYDSYNLRQIENYSATILTGALTVNQQPYQLDCFGLVFPLGCMYYRGPHSTECLSTIWEDIGCLQEGYYYPTNHTPQESAYVDTLNLRDVRQHAEDLITNAESGIVDAQLNCFGYKFPDGCDVYRGLNLVKCYSSLWKKAGCTADGLEHPENPNSTKNALFTGLNLREIEDYVSEIKKEALSPNTQAQLDCFGHEFLPGCKYYRGPHPRKCKQSLWKSVGCLEVGYKYPPNISDSERYHTNSINLDEMKAYYRNLTDVANAGDADTQLNCYGLKFPNGCNEYRGPHNASCYMSLWLEIGSIEAGRLAPSTIDIARSAPYFNGSDLREVKEIMQEMVKNATKGNKEAQLDSFGFEFLPGCMYYRGPHSEECQMSVWINASLLEAGFNYPNNISKRQNKSMNALNLNELKTYNEKLKLKAESGNVEAQLQSFGLKFPNGCISYTGLQPDLCYQTIWNKVGCREEGYWNPVDVKNGPRKAIYEPLNLRQVEAYMHENLLSLAVDGNIQAQFDCFGLEFPKGCRYFRGPHSEECQETIWQEEGCLESGLEAAHKISRRENKTRNEFDLVELREYFNDINISAHSGDTQAQMDCYGLKFPNGCVSYRGPNPEDCYISVFNRAGCIEEGNAYPTKYSESELNELNALDLRSIEMQMIELENRTQNESAAQLDCYGFVFPTGCTLYRGPHSSECQVTIWKQEGCVEEGFKYPPKLSDWENESINALTIIELIAFTKELNISGLAGDVRNQIHCFGMVFPSNCSSYFGPHSESCYLSTWKGVGCIEAGYQSPTNDSAVVKATMDALNLKEVVTYMENRSIEALDLGNASAQYDCFGFAFPDGCVSYYGPHLIECHEGIWIMVGCEETGYRAPANLTPSELAQVNDMTLLEVIDLAEYIFNSSSGEEQAQLDCYGMKFPEGCLSYKGPNPVECYTSIWLEVGCLDNGSYSPMNSTSTENALWDSYNLRQVREDVEQRLERALTSNDFHDQLDCFGIIFPDGCTFFRGPHPLKCQESIWESQGCLEEGQFHPAEVTDLKNATLNAMTLTELIEYVVNITKLAESGDEAAQMNCYGLSFPTGCTSYYGPHPLLCHETVWAEEGCISEGYDHPSKRSVVRTETFNYSTIRDIQNFTRNLKNEALALKNQSQLDCFGINFPFGCISYDGPHTNRCLEGIFLEAGCIEEGFSYPANLTPALKTALNAKNLVEVQAYTAEFFSKATGGDSQAQRDCFGLKFPDFCSKYEGPLPANCHDTIWLKVGCVSEGHQFPSKSLDASNNFTLPDADIRGLEVHYNDILEKTWEKQKEAQLNCFGIEFPEGCKYYRGPHSNQCVSIIWRDAGCSVYGYNHPANLSSEERSKLSSFTIAQIQAQHKTLFDSAIAGNETDQLFCFGTKFPNGCRSYEGPNSLECYKTIWKAVGCLKEGYDYPDNFTSRENAQLHGFTLREVRNHMEEIASSAIPPNTHAQLDCYGIEFPPNCTRYRGPHLPECQKYYWVKAGCVSQGWYYPYNRTYADDYSVGINDMSLRELEIHFLNFSHLAGNGSSIDQLYCFGMKFPNGCVRYRGPHELQCYKNLWADAGCTEHGLYYPRDQSRASPPSSTPPYLADVSEKQTDSTKIFDELNLRELIYFLCNISKDARDGNSEAQIQCFGRSFPYGCVSFTGVHSDQCLESMWKRVGCVPEGFCHPSNLSGFKNSSLRSTNLDELYTFMKNLSDTSLMSDEESQLNCYGMKFPTGCVSYRGVHDVSCLNTIWKSVGCIEEGLAYPEAPNSSDSSDIEVYDSLNLRQVRNLIESIIESAIADQNNQSQLDCFGQIFREGCIFFRGPHPRECLETVWEDVGCLESGFLHPKNRSHGEIATLGDFNLVELEDEFRSYAVDAGAGDADDQLNCFGIKFPSGCVSYLEPHSVECLNSIWKKIGCVKEGLGYPDILSSQDFSNIPSNLSFLSSRLNTLNTFNLREVHKYMKDIIASALSLDTIAQLDCFGQAFPFACRFYRGPHSLHCLKTIWNHSGCIDEGFGNPNNYSPSLNSTIANMNLSAVEEYMNNFRIEADVNVTDAQLECYGIKFPAGCVTYNGPHSLDCLRRIWEEVGCVEEGIGYERISSGQENSSKSLNIREIRDRFQKVLDEAISMITVAQLDCFGLEFPDGCEFFRGPHSQQCIMTAWLEAGCIEQGYGNLSNISVSAVDDLSNMDLYELQQHMEDIYTQAKTDVETPQSIKAQLLCYGLKFPKGCDTFEGPHSVTCLNTIWKLEGCIEEGCSYPSNLSASDDLAILMNNSNIIVVKEIVKNITTDAIYCSNLEARLACFGLEFPVGCNFYRGPHQTSCQHSLWRESGCLEVGRYNPESFTSAQSDLISSFNLRDALDYFINISIKADNGSQDAQLDCYGMKYPTDCTLYNGPNSIECYQSIWKGVGCLDIGRTYPDNNMTEAMKSALDQCNLRGVTAYMQNISNETREGNGEAQLDCYGIVFPCDCHSYEGPHTNSCLMMAWTDVGCVYEGWLSPDNITDSQKSMLNAFNIPELKAHIKELSDRALEPHVQSQLDCYGLEFPPGCDSYRGPHKMDCFMHFWNNSGCVDEGYDHPHNLSGSANSTANGLTLHELKQTFDGIMERAVTFSVQSQLECFGLAFPCGCQFYRGPHSLECQISVYLAAGCIQEGFKYPTELDYSQNETVKFLNLRELSNYTASIRQLALDGNFLPQCDCYGVGFPGPCKTYFGPHDFDCYIYLWKEAGCTLEGYDRPTNLTAQALALLDALDIRELRKHMKDVGDRADKLEKGGMHSCYGRYYPFGCDDNLPPHSKECLVSLWEGAGCEDIGFLNPSNLTGCENDTVQNLKLMQLQDFFENYTIRARVPNATHDQLNCYGIVFLDSCVEYEGPNDLECYLNVWLDVGCLEEGHGNPYNLSSKNLSRLHAKDLRKLREHMSDILHATTLGSNRSQLDCFGLNFPEGCVYFRGPHSIECLQNTWKVAGCSEYGLEYPGSNMISPNPGFAFENLHDLIEAIQNITIRAGQGDAASQIACYGIQFLDECPTYQGPFTDLCLLTIWDLSGCTDTGTSFPGTRGDREKMNKWNLRQVNSEASNISDEAFIHHNPEAQVKCLGFVFPNSCRSSDGPHSLSCLNELFSQSGCNEFGRKAPRNLPRTRAQALQTTSLIDLKGNMESLASDARGINNQKLLDCFGIIPPSICLPFDKRMTLQCYSEIYFLVGCIADGEANPNNFSSFVQLEITFLKLTEALLAMQRLKSLANYDRDAQIGCYGFAFPPECVNITGPHSLECLNAVWTFVGCLEAGTKFPQTTSTSQRVRDLKAANLKNVVDDMTRAFRTAVSPPPRDGLQIECFGETLSRVCYNVFIGPYSLDCYEKIWTGENCAIEGLEYQPNLSPERRALFDSWDILRFQKYIRNLSEFAFTPDTKAQMDCFGRLFPDTCKELIPPHVYPCIRDLYLYHGCLPDGFLHPFNRTNITEQGVVYFLLNLVELYDHYETFSTKSFEGVEYYQYACFGSLFPSECKMFLPELDMRCLNGLWHYVGCGRNGTAHPSRLPSDEIGILNSTNVTETMLPLRVFYDRAHLGYEDFQTDCYGYVFPEGCLTFFGPHSTQCYANIWLEQGCAKSGTYYIHSVTDVATRTALLNKNLSAIIDESKNLHYRSVAGERMAQLQCHGIVFPENCSTFLGPFSLKCKISAFEGQGCNIQGQSHPTKISTFENITLNRINLYEMTKRAESLYSSASQFVDKAQLKCFGRTIFRICQKFEGPHSLECYLKLWGEVGCVQKGEQSPRNIKKATNDTLNTYNYNQVFDFMTSFFNKSYYSDDHEAQRACFGTTMTNFCRYHPPISERCLDHEFEEALCTRYGHSLPSKASSAEKIALSAINLAQIRMQFSALNQLAESGDVEGRLDCYGLKFPQGCTLYRGPHPVECFENVWTEVGCGMQGRLHPQRMDYSQVVRLSYSPLREMIEFMQNISNAAAALDLEAQLDCFGRPLPRGCRKFSATLSLRCMSTVWASVGCIEEGNANPVKYTEEEAVAARLLNIDELRRGMAAIYNLSLQGNASAQLDCFGLVFPGDCHQYVHPLYDDCYISAWESVGCSPEGRRYIKKRRNAELAELDRLNLRQILEQFNLLSQQALSGGEEPQLDCFGHVFSKICDKAVGPFNRRCLESIWLEVGCAKQGKKSPSQISDEEAAAINRLKLVPLKRLMQGYYERAFLGDATAQIDCFGLAFPLNCDTFFGELSIECYETIWEGAGCVREGEDHPRSLTPNRLRTLRSLTLGEAYTRLTSIGRRAYEMRPLSQAKCFGMVFPSSCFRFLGLHNITCFNDMWKLAGCSSRGSDYPQTLTGPKWDALFFLSNASLWEVLAHMEAYIERAKTSQQAQLECHGMIFPNNCISYHGPFSAECLETILLGAGCLDTGTLMPSRISIRDNETVQKLDLRELIEFMRNVHAQAENSNQEAVLKCFGNIFPPECGRYGGPHSSECVEGLWLSAGCLEIGHGYPQNLSVMENTTLNTFNLREIFEQMKGIREEGEAGDLQAQIDCYGLEFYAYCKVYEPILSVECLNSIFKLFCVEEGTLYPGRADEAMLGTIWNTKNQRQVVEAAKAIRDGALSENATSERQCYGLAFPDDCDRFYRDHSLKCIMNIWEAVGCSIHGYKAPANLSRADLETLVLMNLRKIFNYVENIYESASDYQASDTRAQLDCFGTLLTRDCPIFHELLSEYCLTSLWLGVGCLRDGIITPYKFSEEERLQIWDGNLYETRAKMKAIYEDALRGNPLGLLECYGVFPENCTMFEGPLTVECLSSMWLSVGCKRPGHGYPASLHPTKRKKTYKKFDMRKTYLIMLKAYQGAISGKEAAQLVCFGKTFPAVCKMYESPLPINCLVAVWNGTGCRGTGQDYPGRLSTIQSTVWENMHLGQVQSYVHHLRRVANDGNREAQLDCYGTTFLDECIAYDAPHTQECYNAIWKGVGCTERGYKYPSNRSAQETQILNELNLLEIQEQMLTTKRLSNSLNVPAQYDCFGFKLPYGCLKFEGPHPPLCLNSVLNYVGLTEFPGTLTREINDTLNAMNVEELINHFSDIRDELDDELASFEPSECDSVFPPLTHECINGVWINQAGCSAEGTDYPGNLDPVVVTRTYENMNLQQLNKTMTAIRVKAFSPDRDAQIRCFGTEINENCSAFHPPLSHRCLNSVWLNDVGCFRKGVLFPGSLNAREFLEAWGRKNFREAQDLMKMMKEKALSFDKKSLRECHGRELPLWAYGVASTAVKLIMTTIASLVLLGLSYAVYRLCNNFSDASDHSSDKPKMNVEDISYKKDDVDESPYIGGEYDTSDTELSYSYN